MQKYIRINTSNWHVVFLEVVRIGIAVGIGLRKVQFVHKKKLVFIEKLDLLNLQFLQDGGSGGVRLTNIQFLVDLTEGWLRF